MQRRMRKSADNFDLKSYVASRQKIVEKALLAVLPSSSAVPRELHKAMRHSVLAGGKRLRPILCMAAAEAVGGRASDALLPGIAIELFHTYTLVHDDLPCMDDDDTRRGKPTCHVLFGDAIAVLAGDALQTLAFEILSRTDRLPASTAVRMVKELSLAAGSQGVAGGQAEDVAVAEGKPVDRKLVKFIHLHKTADLFKASCRIGGIAGGASPAQMNRLTSYGINLGVAFQVTDDLLDAGQKKSKPDGASCLDVGTLREARDSAAKSISLAAESARSLPRGNALAAIAMAIKTRTS